VRALVKSRPGRGLDLLEVSDPAPGDGEILLEVAAAGVCGSDVARFVWTRNHEAGAAKSMADDLPRVLGHEYAGTIVEIGPEVDPALIGRRAVVQNVLSCGRCEACGQGTINLCAERRTLGVHRDGGYAELAAVPAANVFPIADSLNFSLAAAITPFAVSSNAVELAGLRPGHRVIVIGVGPIGIAAALAARLRGADVVGVLDRNPVRLQDAEAIGFAGIDTRDIDVRSRLLEVLGPRSVDAVIEAAGVADAVTWTLPVLKKGRPIVLLGNQRETAQIDLMPIVMDQQRIVGSRSYSMTVWRQALATIERSGMDRLLGDDVGFEEAIVRFEEAADGHGRPFTVVPGR
jgi:threonine dehydrogenase-like Zn-dependent dehydrogenase